MRRQATSGRTSHDNLHRSFTISRPTASGYRARVIPVTPTPHLAWVQDYGKFFFFMYSVMCLNSQAGLRCGAANPPSNSFCLAHTGYGLSTATIPRSASVLSVVRPNRIDRQELTTPLCRVPAATQPTQFRGQNVWPSRRERECERFFYELPLNFF